MVKITRVERSRYETIDLGAVVFVPLIGAEGWSEADPDGPTSRASNGTPAASS